MSFGLDYKKQEYEYENHSVTEYNKKASQHFGPRLLKDPQESVLFFSHLHCLPEILAIYVSYPEDSSQRRSASWFSLFRRTRYIAVYIGNIFTPYLLG